jgi:hypothetical protein
MSYELKTGKFGVYFFDNDSENDLTLEVVLALLNTSHSYLSSANKEINDLKTQLAAKDGKYDAIYITCLELEDQLANSIPKERVEALINDDSKQFDIGGWIARRVVFVDDLRELLSNQSKGGE